MLTDFILLIKLPDNNLSNASRGEYQFRKGQFETMCVCLDYRALGLDLAFVSVGSTAMMSRHDVLAISRQLSVST